MAGWLGGWLGVCGWVGGGRRRGSEGKRGEAGREKGTGVGGVPSVWLLH